MSQSIPPGTVLDARSFDLQGVGDETRVWVRPAPEPPRPERLASGSSPSLEVRTRPARQADAPPPVEVFSLIRRIALQRDLANATGVLHAGLAELAVANIVLVQILDKGALSCPVLSDLRAAAKHIPMPAIVEAHRRKQRFLTERVVMIPLGTTTPTVLVAWRKDRQPAFEAIALRVLAQTAQRLSVLDHFLVLAAQSHAQAAADQDSVFRAEALEAARGDKRESELVELSPRTLRISVPLLGLVAAGLIAAAAIVHVPTYSRGVAVVQMNGQKVIANTTGRVAKTLVTEGQRVVAGEPLIELDTTTERQQFEQIDTLDRDQLSTFLFDETDEAARHSLGALVAQRKSALDSLAAKTITAPCDGTVGELLSPDLVQGGEHVATIVPDDAALSIVSYLPGRDSAHIKPGMQMQIELAGYSSDSRVTVTIVDVSQIMGASSARKLLGQKLGDSVMLPQDVVRVTAALTSREFTSRGKTFQYADGMNGLAEIQIDTKSFLSVVIPSGD